MTSKQLVLLLELKPFKAILKKQDFPRILSETDLVVTLLGFFKSIIATTSGNTSHRIIECVGRDLKDHVVLVSLSWMGRNTFH